MERFSPSQLRQRHSVRVFDGRQLSESDMKAVNASLTMVNSHEAGMHFTLVTDNAKAFEGMRRNYGMFRNVRDYIACVVDTSYAHAYERAGFFAQKIVMEATMRGLGTCYVGGTFDAAEVPVQLRPDYKLLFVIAIGYAAEKTQTFLSGIAMKMAHRKDLSYDGFYVADNMALSDASDMWPWLESGLQSLVCAPSSLNKQPVRIHVRDCADGQFICAYVDNPDNKKLIDLGIGKYNFAAATGVEWEWGNDAPALPPL